MSKKILILASFAAFLLVCAGSLRVWARDSDGGLKKEWVKSFVWFDNFSNECDAEESKSLENEIRVVEKVEDGKSSSMSVTMDPVKGVVVIVKEGGEEKEYSAPSMDEFMKKFPEVAEKHKMIFYHNKDLGELDFVKPIFPGDPHFPKEAWVDGGFLKDFEKLLGDRIPMPKIPKEEMEAEKDVRDAVEDLKKAKTEEEKKSIRKDIEAKLGKLFDMREKRREDRVAEMEKELKELKDEIKFRKDNKTKIIEKRMGQLMGEKDPYNW